MGTSKALFQSRVVLITVSLRGGLLVCLWLLCVAMSGCKARTQGGSFLLAVEEEKKTPAGSPSPSPSPSPTPSASPTPPVFFAAMWKSTCFGTANNIKCWGSNQVGELARPTAGGEFSTTAVPATSLAGVMLGSLSGQVYEFVATSADNTELYTWGTYGPGLLHTFPHPVPGAKAVTVFGQRTKWCFINDQDLVICYGQNLNGELGRGFTSSFESDLVGVSGLGPVKSIASGDDHICALKAAGTVHCWGANYFGQTGINNENVPITVPTEVPGLTNVQSIAAAVFRNVAITQDGRVLSWSGGTVTEIAGITNAKKVSLDPSPGGARCAVRADGGVSCWKGLTAATDVPGLSNIVDVAVGRYHACALSGSGAVYCWSTVDSDVSNNLGQLGNGTTTRSLTPVQVLGL